ncbi:unnamed protein product [Adineta steineri]|uniref:Polymerase nucleotidyl transferase domain-containing protein n=1 Tax=Adineta steineri TaxID=433720 RepID=A0A819GFW8_9BILA|nr:unnamed protein product [Adineta steineri]CAF3885179.1 unnamed protein product [Adineta steineri]
MKNFTYENSQLSSSDIDELIQRFDKSNVVQALILMGSYARNEAGPHSDIDLVRFVIAGTKLSDDGTHLLKKKVLITICTVEPIDYEKWFTDPYEATKWIAGLKIARVLIDRENCFTDRLQRRAHDFVWDATMQLHANIEASRRMVGWCEETNKGLEGLRRNYDIGRLLNACHGLSWGLSEVIQIHRGILISSDNNFFNEIESALADNKRMIELRRITFGVIGSYTLRQRVIAGLHFFVLLAKQMSNVWQVTDVEIIEHTVQHINLNVPNLVSENILCE